MPGNRETYSPAMFAVTHQSLENQPWNQADTGQQIKEAQRAWFLGILLKSETALLLDLLF